MKTYKNLYERVCSFENLYAAFLKARKHKKYNQVVLRFEYNLEKELFCLKRSLENFTYQPRPQKEFMVYKDCRKIFSVSVFSDKVVQHALKNVINPVFENGFIFDSYAFRPGKGTHSALERFDEFERRVAPRRFPNSGFILKADIKDYYSSVDHNILNRILKEKISDEKIIKLIEIILSICPGDKGIAVGSPCSQLFANIYLNKLDYFVKHILREGYYLRYCDDFVILKKRRCPLEIIKAKVGQFLKEKLLLEFNIDKTRIVSTNKGLVLLGYKVFYHYKLLRKRNVKAFKAKLKTGQEDIQQGRLDIPELSRRIRGWVEYARYANSYGLRKKLLSRTLCN